MIAPRATYDISVDHDDMVISIFDRNGARSLTNDPERAIADIIASGVVHQIHDYVVIYRDSTGVWDGMRITDGRFDGFELINARQPKTAIYLMWVRRTRVRHEAEQQALAAYWDATTPAAQRAAVARMTALGMRCIPEKDKAQ